MALNKNPCLEWLDAPSLPDLFTGDDTQGIMDTSQLVIAYGFILAGFGFVIWTILLVLKAGRAESWPTAPGTIVISQVKQKMGRRFLMYWPEIQYEYMVNGQRYDSGVWRLGARKVRLSWPSVAQRAVARYPCGKTVTVSYNPDDPHDALLEPGAIDWTGFTLGMIFMILPATVIIISKW
ncbi:MAG TPA: DUF3592 domain-containing protein [Candidatus Angelobacter sp.]